MKLFLPFLLLVALSSGCQYPFPAPQNPNIIILMSDDMGYSDLGCYGGEIHTPNLDQLAQGGLRFRNFYTNPMCCPSRAAMLTGVYPHQAGMGRMMSNLGTPSYQGELNELPLLPEILQAAGYQTYMSGKWHLTQPENPKNWPMQRGFDAFFGNLLGTVSYFSPTYLYRNNQRIDDEAFQDSAYYYTYEIVGNAVNFIHTASTSEKPFFLYVAFNAPHWPLHAKEQDIQTYAGKFSEGWDILRVKRMEKMTEMGLFPKGFPMSPRDTLNPQWEQESHKAWQVRRMETYAAQITSMDKGIGRICESLKSVGQWENTLILFLNDNGGCHVEYHPEREGPFLPNRTRDGSPIVKGNLPEIKPGGENTFTSYGRQWANLSNTPFRLYKSYVYEGGIRSPLIAHYPALISAGNSWTSSLAHVMDILPTILELTGIAYPQSLSSLPLEGKSFLPSLKNPETQTERTIFWEHATASAVRKGDWKLVSQREGPWELYHLREDPTELYELSHLYPEKAQKLAGLYDQWKKRVGVIERKPHPLLQ